MFRQIEKSSTEGYVFVCPTKKLIFMKHSRGFAKSGDTFLCDNLQFQWSWFGILAYELPPMFAACSHLAITAPRWGPDLQ